VRIYSFGDFFFCRLFVIIGNLIYEKILRENENEKGEILFSLALFKKIFIQFMMKIKLFFHKTNLYICQVKFH